MMKSTVSMYKMETKWSKRKCKPIFFCVKNKTETAESPQ